MADLLTIGASAAQLYKSGLATVSNNIANLTTEGYNRQSINVSESAPNFHGQSYIGTGANLASVTRAYNGFAENNLRQSKGELSIQDQLIDYTSQIVDVMGSDSAGLNQAMDRFFDAAGGLSIDPASIAMRSSFLNEAQGLAIRFNELADYLNDVEQDTQFAIEVKTTRLNNLAEQLVTINSELKENLDVTKQPPGLLDQRDKTLLEMAEIANIYVIEGNSGAVDIRLDNAFGTMVIDNNRANQFSTQFNQPKVGSVEIISSYGALGNVTDMTGGALGGLLSVRSQVLMPTIAKLDDLANTLTTQVNAIQIAGYDANGIFLGTDMFGNDGVTTGAAGLTLLLSDPMKIAAARQPGSTGDNSNMVLMARLQTTHVMEETGGTPAKNTLSLTDDDVANFAGTMTLNDGATTVTLTQADIRNQGSTTAGLANLINARGVSFTASITGDDMVLTSADGNPRVTVTTGTLIGVSDASAIPPTNTLSLTDTQISNFVGTMTLNDGATTVTLSQADIRDQGTTAKLSDFINSSKVLPGLDVTASTNGDKIILTSGVGKLFVEVIIGTPIGAPVYGGGSLTDGYNSIVTAVGSQATLAKISKDALQVVFEQATAEKDRISGVSLDEEAADLIRYQQAFQASAKIIEVSSKLFDTILGVR